MKLIHIFNTLSEALSPSQYRSYTKGWDKTKYNDIFNNEKNTDKNKFRIYIPLSDIEATPDEKIVKVLNDAGFEIQDYIKGLAKNKKDGRTVRIGKILDRADAKEEKIKFDNDVYRRASSERGSLEVVISRHPYDIAGMSTDRHWDSCMNLGKKENDITTHYIMDDVKEGTLIAYLISKNDRNIKNPYARVLIKPFLKRGNKKEFILMHEGMVYGNAPPNFLKTVDEWLSKVNKGKDRGVYCINPKLYIDSDSNEVKYNLTDVMKEIDDSYDLSDVIDLPKTEDEINYMIYKLGTERSTKAKEFFSREDIEKIIKSKKTIDYIIDVSPNILYMYPYLNDSLIEYAIKRLIDSNVKDKYYFNSKLSLIIMSLVKRHTNRKKIVDFVLNKYPAIGVLVSNGYFTQEEIIDFAKTDEQFLFNSGLEWLVNQPIFYKNKNLNFAKAPYEFMVNLVGYGNILEILDFDSLLEGITNKKILLFFDKKFLVFNTDKFEKLVKRLKEVDTPTKEDFSYILSTAKIFSKVTEIENILNKEQIV